MHSTTDTPHYEQVPFEIPSSWEWTTLGEVFTLQAGKNITAKDISDKEDSEHRFPCYGGNGLRGYVCSYNRNGRFPLIGRQGALCGNINFAEGLFYATEHAVVVETYCKTDVEWAVHSLIHLNLNQYATSTAQPGLSVNTINEVLIPLPPIEEQGRIVRCLNKWNTLIGQIEQGKVDLQTTIKQTKSKILDLAIHGKLVPQDPNDEPASELLKRINPKAEFACDNGQYGKVPEEWIMCTIGDLFDVVSAKRVLKSDWKNKGIPFYRAREIVQLHKEGIADKDLFITEELFAELKDKFGTPNVGDIMLSAVGSIGYTYIVNEKDSFYYKDASVLCLRNVNKLNSQYFSMLFETTFVKEQMHDNSKGTTVDTITIEKLKKYFVPLPPLAEQHRIVTKIEELFSSLDNIQKALEV